MADNHSPEERSYNMSRFGAETPNLKKSYESIFFQGDFDIEEMTNAIPANQMLFFQNIEQLSLLMVVSGILIADARGL